MGSVAVGEERNKGADRHTPRRAGIKLDMTPLVDVAFLLLTFFMFATTMSQPQVMEIQVPKELHPVEVDPSKLLTLYVRNDNRVFYRAGNETMLHPIDLDVLKEMATERNAAKGNDLILTLKVDHRAKYATLVDVLDELNLAEGELVAQYSAMNMKRERRFTIAPLDVNEQRELELL